MHVPLRSTSMSLLIRQLIRQRRLSPTVYPGLRGAGPASVGLAFQ